MESFAIKTKQGDITEACRRAGVINTVYYTSKKIEKIDFSAGTVFEPEDFYAGLEVEHRVGEDGYYDRQPFKMIKLIVVSYTDVDGNTWNTPYADDFKSFFKGGVEYEDNMKIKVSQ